MTALPSGLSNNLCSFSIAPASEASNRTSPAIPLPFWLTANFAPVFSHSPALRRPTGKRTMKWISVLAAAAAFFAPASSSPVKSERAVRDCVTVYRLRVSKYVSFSLFLTRLLVALMRGSIHEEVELLDTDFRISIIVWT